MPIENARTPYSSSYPLQFVSMGWDRACRTAAVPIFRCGNLQPSALCCRSPTLGNAAVRPVRPDFRCNRKIRWWANSQCAERLCENSQFVSFWCRSFFECDEFVAQLNERGHKFSHFRRFAAAPIVFTQPRPTADIHGWPSECRLWRYSRCRTSTNSVSCINPIFLSEVDM